MPLPLPDLDDRTFADLMDEVRALIPTYDPAWTDHNPSDPGITLIELFAWLAEMLMYRANQVPDRHLITFLRLLNGPEWTPSGDLPEDIRTSVTALRRLDRAVTCEDYEALAIEASPAVARAKCLPRRYLDAGTEGERTAPQAGYVSTIVVPRRVFDAVWVVNEAFTDHTAEATIEGGIEFALVSAPTGFLYVGSAAAFSGIRFQFRTPGAGYALRWQYFDGSDWVLLRRVTHAFVDHTANWSLDASATFRMPADWAPTSVNGATRYWIRISTTTAPTTVAQALQIVPLAVPQPSRELIEQVRSHLDPRRILTTRHRVVGPIYAPVHAEILLARHSDVPETDVRRDVVAALERFLDPLAGGPGGKGWPFGRDVYVSELYQLLENVASVDYVADITIFSECPADAIRCAVASELWHEDGDLVGLDLAAHHLPQAQIDSDAIVIATAFVAVRLTLSVTRVPSVTPTAARSAAKTVVKRLFHPLHGGPDGSAARTISVNSIRTRVTNHPAITSVDVVTLHATPDRLQRDDEGNVTGVRIEEGKLVDVQVTVLTN